MRVVQILQNPDFPKDFPFGPEEFQRYDETADTSFYSQPRFVTHIDDGAIAALTKYNSIIQHAVYCCFTATQQSDSPRTVMQCDRCMHCLSCTSIGFTLDTEPAACYTP